MPVLFVHDCSLNLLLGKGKLENWSLSHMNENLLADESMGSGSSTCTLLAALVCSWVWPWLIEGVVA